MLSVVIVRVIMAYCHAVLSYVLAWHLILFRKRAFMKRYWYYHMQCWKIINKFWLKILYLKIKVSLVLQIAMSVFKIKSTSLVIAKTWSYIPASCYLHTSNKIFNSKYCHILCILLKLKPHRFWLQWPLPVRTTQNLQCLKNLSTRSQGLNAIKLFYYSNLQVFVISQFVVLYAFPALCKVGQESTLQWSTWIVLNWVHPGNICKY